MLTDTRQFDPLGVWIWTWKPGIRRL